jgi:thioredoxin 1
MANSPVRSDDGDGAADEIESTERFENLLAAESKVLVDFYAEWCGPCKMMASTVDELAAESDAAVVKVNVETLPYLAAEYEVQSIPAFVLIEDGTKTDHLVGLQEKDDLQSAIESAG